MLNKNMELSTQFYKFCQDYFGQESLRPASIGEDDETQSILEEVAQFCGTTLSDCKIYELHGDPMDVATAMRWINKFCTAYDDNTEPEVYVASDFSFFAELATGLKLRIYSPSLKISEGWVPTFESWVKTKSIEELAKKHNVSTKHIEKQLEMGMEEETEHTDSPKYRRIIALNHIDGDPNYYTKLNKAGL